jgi:hypothetical protein
MTEPLIRFRGPGALEGVPPQPGGPNVRKKTAAARGFLTVP